jgi:hypothetical protein
MAIHASAVGVRLLSCGLILGLSVARHAQAQGPAQAQDVFVEQHRAALAANVAGLRFSVRLLDDKGWFRQGDLIPIELLYESLDGHWHGVQFDCPSSPACHSIEVALDRTDGVTLWPQRGRRRRSSFPPAGGPGCLMFDTLEPVKELPPPRRHAMVLNDRIRFDRPGHYRLYLGKHLLRLGSTEHGVQATDNILDIEIRPKGDRVH